jgi:cytochrome c-type biogenesis protein
MTDASEAHHAADVGKAGESGKRGRGIWRGAGLVTVLLMTLALASAWLVFPYFFEGRNLLQNVGGEVMSARIAEERTTGQAVTRYAFGPGEAETSVLFGTELYFARTATARVRASFEPDKYLVFIVNETTHDTALPQVLPKAELVVDGVSHAPVDYDGPLDTDHHRSTVVRFARSGADGAPIISEATTRVEVVITSAWDPDSTPRTAEWSLPIEYPPEANVLKSPTMAMALAAGLLSATLTPCLLQLIVVYMATLTGVSAGELGRGGAVPAVVRRKMLISALAFIVGFTAFYTAAGAAIGYAGKSAQILFSAWSREMAIGSGILVMAMGLWMGIKARAPLVCRMPMARQMAASDKGSFLRSALMAAGFSLGCMVCFSGAIIATLFIYVGALGSATTGALILFLFSMGVAVPFLLAAVFLSRTMTVMSWISRYTPQIGFVSMIVIMAFGLVLITDNFHTVSDLIYPWLGLN